MQSGGGGGWCDLPVDPRIRGPLAYLGGGVGYLFAHHDTAAKLGEQVGADYVLVGRLHKPSFLFSYLMGHLVRVSDAKLIGNYISEAKGPNLKLTIKTVESLAVKIDKTLDNKYSPPPPKTKN